MDSKEIVKRFEEDRLLKEKRKEEFKKRHFPYYDGQCWNSDDEVYFNTEFRDAEKKHQKLALFLEYVLEIFSRPIRYLRDYFI